MFFLLNILWIFRTYKFVLFWVYLWQLKEYHSGRFLDHFNTAKGRKLLFNFNQIAKIVLLFFLIFTNTVFPLVFSVLFLIYAIEAAVFIKGILRKSVKKPVKTFKTLFLVLVLFALVVLFLAWTLKFSDAMQVILLVVFDILLPMIVSIIVLFFQPFFVFARDRFLAKAGQKLKDFPDLTVIAITGSYGKTSTKEFLTTILSKKFKVLSTKEHKNSEIGVADTILNSLDASHQIFIAEVGAYNKGKVRQVCSALKPKIGIVTGVNEQHLALFRSMKNLLSAEGGGELASVLPKNGLLAVNGDNKHCIDLIKKTDTQAEKRVYTLHEGKIDSDIWTEDIVVKEDLITFLAQDKQGEMFHFEVKVLGKQNVQNLLAAILVAKHLGMTFEEISNACKGIKPEQAGMVLKQGKHGIRIVDSSYSSNPDGVIADLDYVSIFARRKVVVMPCLIELGRESEKIHEKLGAKIAQVCDLAIITTADKFREIKEGFDQAKNKNKKHEDIARCVLCENPEDIYSLITLFCKEGDTVLLEGRVPGQLIKLLQA